MAELGGFDRDAVDEVIAVIKYADWFRWYKSDREFWVLDRKKWRQEFVDHGHHVPELDLGNRFGIPVVNEETANRFLAAMQGFSIAKDDLSRQLVARFASAQSAWDILDLLPIVFVDFDRKHVCAFYPEGTRVERFAPAGWTSEFEDFLTRYSEEDFPLSEKYWVQDGVDMLKELTERPRRIKH